MSDKLTEKRKEEHIDLTFSSRPQRKLCMGDLYYEPLLSPHPDKGAKLTQTFIGHEFELPLWISSMTGGTAKAKNININLAKSCKDFGLGMGLGSCRALLEGRSGFYDFDVKCHMGDAPLYINLGIAQLEELVNKGRLKDVEKIILDLGAQGLVIHVNPLQEWAQEGGDRYKKSPICTIEDCLSSLSTPLIVKEVGQGIGPKSLKLLTQLPLEAIELSGFGGTNFTLLEEARLFGANSSKKSFKSHLGFVGHSLTEMVGWLNEWDTAEMKCTQFIVSGGILEPLEGYILNSKLQFNSVFGMASGLLKYADTDYEVLFEYLEGAKRELLMAQSFLQKK